MSESSDSGAVGRHADVRVAVVGPLTGVRRAWGALLTESAHRHRRPGIAFELHDDGADPGRAEELAKDIVAAGDYAAVIGHFNSFGAQAALPHYRQAQLPAVLPLSTAPGLLTDGDLALRWCGDNVTQLAAIVSAAESRGFTWLPARDDGSPYGRQLHADFAHLTGRTGAMESAESDLAEAPANTALAVFGTHAGAADVANSLRAKGYGGALFFPDDCSVAEFTRLLRPSEFPAFTARLSGTPEGLVNEAFAALTGAIIAQPDARGADLLSLVRQHADRTFTREGEPDQLTDAWEVVDLGAGTARQTPPPAPSGGTSELDCIVIGAGITGSAVTAALARRGQHVALVGPGADAPSATRHSGGLVRAFEPDPRVRKLAIASHVLLWGRSAAASRAYGFRRTGSLVLLGSADLAMAERGITELRQAGVDAELIDGADLHRRWPDLAARDVAGAVWEPGGGYTAPLATASAYRAIAARRGADRWYRQVLHVAPYDDGVEVVTDDGRLYARTAVIATGSTVPNLRNRNGAMLKPTARVKRIRYGYFGTRGRSMPSIMDLVTGMWGRPELGGDSVLVGRPVEVWDVPADGGEDLTGDQVDYIRTGAATRWPWLAEAAYLGGQYGADFFRPAGPALEAVCDGLPIVVAGIFSGGGVKVAPAAAEHVADQVESLLSGGTARLEAA